MEIHHLTRLQAEIDHRRQILATEADRHHVVAAGSASAGGLGSAESDGPGHALRVRLGAAFVMAGEALLGRDRLDDPCADAARHS